jgi:hypothetical protein
MTPPFPTSDGRAVHAHIIQGDTAKAQAAYQDFLTLWKDADPDIPIFIAAKAEVREASIASFGATARFPLNKSQSTFNWSQMEQPWRCEVVVKLSVLLERAMGIETTSEAWEAYCT